MIKLKIQNSKFKTLYSLLALLLFTLHFSLITEVYAEEAQTVTAEGFGAVVDGNKAIARDNAVKDAQRKAVEQAVGAMISSETAVQNFQLLSDKIFSQSQGYIQSYKIVSEGAQDGTLYRVSIQASVATGGLKNDLGALGLLMQKVEKPRVLFMIAEQNIGQEFYVFWWYGKSEYKGQSFEMAASETALKEEFLAKGFNVVDSSVATGKIDVSNAYRIADLTDSGAISIGKQLGAEVVVKGKAIAKEGPRTGGSNVGSYLADITVSALRVDNGGVLASTRGHGVSRNISQITGGTEALERAAREASEKMIEQITKKWTAETSGGGLVQLTVRGIGAYSDFVKFKDIVQGQVRGVQAIYQRSLDGGTAILDVEIKGTAQNLADEISRKSVGGVPVKVIGASAHTVEVSLGGAVAAVAPPSKTAEPQPQPSSAEQPTSQQTKEDRHWMQPDDYFISERPYEQGYIYVSLAKMKQPSTVKTKSEAQFFRLHDSKDIWVKYFWKTRLAEEKDIQVGALVICFEGNNKSNAYYAPENKNSARTANWFMGRVTDTSDLYKGTVRIDQYNCSPEAIRVPVQ